MRYVDAGYAIALGTLALYAVSLVVRRRRLERAVAAAEDRPPTGHDAASSEGTP